MNLSLGHGLAPSAPGHRNAKQPNFSEWRRLVTWGGLGCGGVACVVFGACDKLVGLGIPSSSASRTCQVQIYTQIYPDPKPHPNLDPNLQPNSDTPCAQILGLLHPKHRTNLCARALSEAVSRHLNLKNLVFVKHPSHGHHIPTPKCLADSSQLRTQIGSHIYTQNKTANTHNW